MCLRYCNNFKHDCFEYLTPFKVLGCSSCKVSQRLANRFLLLDDDYAKYNKRGFDHAKHIKGR